MAVTGLMMIISLLNLTMISPVNLMSYPRNDTRSTQAHDHQWLGLREMFTTKVHDQ